MRGYWKSVFKKLIEMQSTHKSMHGERERDAMVIFIVYKCQRISINQCICVKINIQITMG